MPQAQKNYSWLAVHRSILTMELLVQAGVFIHQWDLAELDRMKAWIETASPVDRYTQTVS